MSDTGYYVFYKDAYQRATRYTVAFFEGTSKRVVERNLTRRAAKTLTDQLNADRAKETQS